MYYEIGTQSAVALAYQRLPTNGILCAQEEIAKQVPGMALAQQAIFPETPEEIFTSPNFAPMMRVVSQELNRFFSGEAGRQALVVLLAVGKERCVVKESTSVDGHIEYGVDCFGPYQRLHLRHLPFRRKKPPVVTRISFGELCFRTEDPREVYRATYQLLDMAAHYLLGNQRSDP